MNTGDIPTVETLRECFVYNAQTGDLLWCHRPEDHFSTKRSFSTWNTKHALKTAGYVDPAGYKRVALSGKNYYVHRIAWALAHGRWPEIEIDHVNGVKDDNRLVNLRDVSHTQNLRNLKKASNNRSGFTGVCWHKHNQKWVAKIKVDGRTLHLGCFEDINEAVSARQAAQTTYRFSEAHGKR